MLDIKISNNVATLSLNRPKVKNALNAELIQKLTLELKKLETDNSIRVIVIEGKNEAFSSGADLQWLHDISESDYEFNYKDSKNFVELINTIDYHKKPIISKVNGPAIGGGTGIALSSDIIVATENSFFGVSEVAIGIIPAAIVHLVIARIGQTKAREFLITGERINANLALELGMINYITTQNELDQKVDELIHRLLKNGPNAIAKVKEMSRTVFSMNHENLNHYISETIANLRTSEEGREGIQSFLNKRKPSWRE